MSVGWSVRRSVRNQLFFGLLGATYASLSNALFFFLPLLGLVNIRLTEHKVNEKEVLANLVKVNVAKKQVEVRLGKTDFGRRKEKRQINKKKKKILENTD